MNVRRLTFALSFYGDMIVRVMRFSRGLCSKDRESVHKAKLASDISKVLLPLLMKGHVVLIGMRHDETDSHDESESRHQYTIPFETTDAAFGNQVDRETYLRIFGEIARQLTITVPIFEPGQTDE